MINKDIYYKAAKKMQKDKQTNLMLMHKQVHELAFKIERANIEAVTILAEMNRALFMEQAND